jgi:AraC-like DNA-binding protein
MSGTAPRVPAQAIPEVLALAVQTLNEPRLGLLLATTANPKRHGLLDYLAATSQTLAIAWERTCRYLVLWNEGVEVRIVPLGNETALEFQPTVTDAPPEGTRQLLTLATATMVLACRAFTGGRATPLRVEFALDAPADASLHETVFGSSVRFGAPITRLIYPSTDAELPLLSADSALAAILTAHADEYLARVGSTTTWAGRVREAIVRGLNTGHGDLASVAHALAVTPRTLQRRLGEEGIGFDALLDQARHTLALSYLPRLSVGEVAWLLNYSDLSTFYRAFKRWTGTTPVSFRASA